MCVKPLAGRGLGEIFLHLGRQAEVSADGAKDGNCSSQATHGGTGLAVSRLLLTCSNSSNPMSSFCQSHCYCIVYSAAAASAADAAADDRMTQLTKTTKKERRHTTHNNMTAASTTGARTERMKVKLIAAFTISVMMVMSLVTLLIF